MLFFFFKEHLQLCFPYFRLIQGIKIPETLVDATYNWWGSERRGYINGKIWDGRDNSSLVEVNFEPYRVSNSSLVNGRSRSKLSF